METREIRHFHVCCGLGGGAMGFNHGRARIGNLEARFRCIGGVDVDERAVRDFAVLAGVPGTRLDLFSRAQYRAFHEDDPPEGWREATPQDLQVAAGGERPHIVFSSAPCRGFSSLLSETRSRTPKYQALNGLTLRSVWLALQAWSNDPPEFFIFENVPRIAKRGRPLLDDIVELLEHAGYSVTESSHDAGELGGLAQSRRRFLLVARHREKVPPFLYQPQHRRLRAVGDVLGSMPLPDDPRGGPMHRLKALRWETWIRLAFVEAGKDWRSLQHLRIEDGLVKDYAIVPARTDWYSGTLGVCRWDQTSGTVTGNARPVTGKFSVADPRFNGTAEYGQYGVRSWDEPTGAVTSQSQPGGGRFSIADPRPMDDRPWFSNVYRVVPWSEAAGTVTTGGNPSNGGQAVADPRGGRDGRRFNNVYRLIAWNDPSQAVTGGSGPSSGALAVADPRAPSTWGGRGKYRVTPFDDAANAVIGASCTGNGAFAVANPRPRWERVPGDAWAGGGHFGVLGWQDTAHAVTGRASHDRGAFAIADPRPMLRPGASLPKAHERLVPIIYALDGTFHRPFTTLELAALQGLVEPDELLVLDGESESSWRERIGNAVPSPAAAAIASVMGEALLLAWSGETFALGSTPIWCDPLRLALSVETPPSVH